MPNKSAHMRALCGLQCLSRKSIMKMSKKYAFDLLSKYSREKILLTLFFVPRDETLTVELTGITSLTGDKLTLSCDFGNVSFSVFGGSFEYLEPLEAPKAVRASSDLQFAACLVFSFPDSNEKLLLYELRVGASA